MEFNLMTQFSWSLRDIDETDIESLFGFSGYALRKSAAPSGDMPLKTAPKQNNMLSVGGKTYKRVSADDASWLG